MIAIRGTAKNRKESSKMNGLETRDVALITLYLFIPPLFIAMQHAEQNARLGALEEACSVEQVEE